MYNNDTFFVASSRQLLEWAEISLRCLGLELGINSKAFGDGITIIYGDLSKIHGQMKGRRKYVLIRTSARAVGLLEKKNA